MTDLSPDSSGTSAEQPHYFTLFDLIEELIGVTFVVVGGYLGWALQPQFQAMFVGGIVGRVVFVGAIRMLRSWANRSRT